MLIFDRNIRGAVAAALLLVVTACASDVGRRSPLESPVTTAVIVGEDHPFTLAAPSGYCVEKGSIEKTRSGTLALLSNCFVDPGNGYPSRTPVTMVLTASVANSSLVPSGQNYSAALDALAQFLATSAGRASIGKTGSDTGVSILETMNTGAALYVLVEDTEFHDPAGQARRFWRAFAEINGRLVTLSATGFSMTDPRQERGLKVLRGFVETLLIANASTGA